MSHQVPWPTDFCHAANAMSEAKTLMDRSLVGRGNPSCRLYHATPYLSLCMLLYPWSHIYVYIIICNKQNMFLYVKHINYIQHTYPQVNKYIFICIYIYIFAYVCKCQRKHWENISTIGRQRSETQEVLLRFSLQVGSSWTSGWL